MKMKRIAAILSLLLSCAALGAQEISIPDTLVTEFSNEYLDTVQVRKRTRINDYSMIGASYGVGLSMQYFNPSFMQDWLFSTNYISVTYSHYEKMFNYLPYFGFNVGAALSHEGYSLSTDKKTGLPYSTIYGATKVRYDMVEIPFLIEAHFDSRFFRFLINLGLYGGYRFNIHREGPFVPEELVNGWAPEDYRWDYGIEGGGGVALVFEPMELHLKVLVRYGFQPLWDPSHFEGQYSPYYYKFANPLDLMFTVGIHFHLSKRYGKSDRQLKKEAREIVYGKKD